MAGEADAHPLHVVTLILAQRTGKGPMMPNRLKLLSLAGDHLIQIHGQIRNRADLKFCGFGDQLGLLIHDIHVNAPRVLPQVSAIMGPISQGFSGGVTGSTFTRLAVRGVRHDWSHIETPLTLSTTTFQSR